MTAPAEPPLKRKPPAFREGFEGCLSPFLVLILSCYYTISFYGGCFVGHVIGSTIGGGIGGIVGVVIGGLVGPLLAFLAYTGITMVFSRDT